MKFFAAALLAGAASAVQIDASLDADQFNTGSGDLPTKTLGGAAAGVRRTATRGPAEVGLAWLLMFGALRMMCHCLCLPGASCVPRRIRWPRLR